MDMLAERVAALLATLTEAALLEELTRRLDGVVRVDNRLGWRLDDEGR